MTTELVKADEETGEVIPEKEQALVPFDRYQGISQTRFGDEIVQKLLEPVAYLDIEIRPDGLIYLPEIKYRRRLNQAFGPGAWALMPTERPSVRDNVIMRPYALYIHGRFVAEAIGEQEYFENNPQMTWATAAEGAKSNAIMRCCKDLGIASELWDPGFIELWKKDLAIQVWVDGKPKPQWRRKDRDPFYNEKGQATKTKVVNDKRRQAEDVGRNIAKPSEVKQAAAELYPDDAPPVEVDWDNLEKEYKKPPPLPPDEPDPSLITDKQQKRFWAIAKGAGWTNDQIKAFFAQANIEGTKFIKKAEYNYLIDRFQQGPAGG